MRRTVAWLAILPCLVAACAHEVVWLGSDAGPPVLPPVQRIPVTLAITMQSFEAQRIDEAAVIDRFAKQIAETELFQAVMYPIPPGVSPRWELRLLVKDSAAEPDANYWRAAIANFLLPAAFFIYMESEYTLEIEALLTQRGELVATYRSTGPIRYRYQDNADLFAMEREGLELIFERTSAEIIDALVRDAELIERADRESTRR